MGENRPTVLVTGGSIAGPALAWSLDRAGYDVTLQERASAMRTAGQNIDIREAGHDVLRAMGLHDEVAGAGTGEQGLRYYDEGGRPYAEFPVRPGKDGATAELEILRGTLSRLLLDLTDSRAEHRYGNHVTAVSQDADGVDVTLDDGRTERYDLLVIAEGRLSRTRDLVFGDEVDFVRREQYFAYGTIARTDGDDDWWRWLTATDNRMVSLRPDNVGTIRASASFLAPRLGLEQLDRDAQFAVLRERFAGVGWETSRILDGFEAAPDEFYLESGDGVSMPRWSDGRVAVLGDAAWGAGPTGMGTTLALVAAYVLAGELHDCADPRDAFAAYERVMRPYAGDVQTVPPAVTRRVLPRGRTALRVNRALYRLAATRPARSLFETVALARGARAFELPSYSLFDNAPAAVSH